MMRSCTPLGVLCRLQGFFAIFLEIFSKFLENCLEMCYNMHVPRCIGSFFCRVFLARELKHSSFLGMSCVFLNAGWAFSRCCCGDV